MDAWEDLGKGEKTLFLAGIPVLTLGLAVFAYAIATDPGTGIPAPLAMGCALSGIGSIMVGGPLSTMWKDLTRDGTRLEGYDRVDTPEEVRDRRTPHDAAASDDVSSLQLRRELGMQRSIQRFEDWQSDQR